MKSEIKFGLIVGLGTCTWILGEYFLGFHNEHYEVGQYTGYLSAIIPIYFIYKGIKQKRDKELGGQLFFGKAFLTGFLISLIAAIIITIFMLIYNKYINPDWMTMATKREELKLLEQGSSPMVVQEKMQEFQKMSSVTSQLIYTFFGILGMGLIITAIESLFLKRRREIQ